ncbi:UBA domain-containing protein 14, partial [Termitomyces sp. J132]
LMMTYGLTSILVGLFDVKHYFHLQLVPHLSRHHQYWRLVLHHLAFSSSSDLFIAQLLLFNAGIQVERQFGSIKYASFVVVSSILVTILELASLIVFHRAGLNHIAMGPAAVVFSIMYQYSRIVPATYKYRIFGVPLNNKSFLYLLAAQTAISRLPSSGAVSIIGILVGQIYRSDLANLKTYRLPSSIVIFATRFLLPFIGALRPPRRSNRALPDDSRGSTTTRNTSATPQNEEVITTARPSAEVATTRHRHNDPSSGGEVTTGTGSVMREWVDELTGRTEHAAAGIRVLPEAEIDQLTAMFPDVQRDVVVAALQRSPNIEAAVETLLSSQT